MLTTSFFQASLMLTSALIGLIIVRKLPKSDYAIYNLLILGSTGILGWGGVGLTSTFIPFVNKTSLGTPDIRKRTLEFQKYNRPLLFLGIIMSLIFCLVSAYKNSWLDVRFWFALVLAITFGFFQFQFRFSESAFKVASKPLIPISVSLVSEVSRLVFFYVILYFLFPFVIENIILLLIFVGLLISFLANKYIKSKFYTSFPVNDTSDNSDTKAFFWSLLKPLLFPAYFYHLSQYFRGWLIYLVSGSTTIADAAALGRLMALFAMMDKSIELVILPKLGAISDYKRYLKKLGISFIVVLLVSLTLLFSAYFFPNFWLWILGEKYTNLGTALIWAVAAAGIERLSGLVLFAQLARGETKNQWWVPILATVVYMGYVFLFGLATPERATQAIFVAALTNLLAQISIFYWRYKSGKIIL